ncbi:hypothetical protein M153_5860001007 [Pseudoloma neurophilia]|uniref:Uncharacterized protein n=1 Tax=Pseudoloma neurophilia TaxID=146866 RepID=A0A0R0M0U0_9MICR|nr:hypothetical protein M153_5860001007 [Pseudoloma neurophilia]
MKPILNKSRFLTTKVGEAGRSNRSIVERYLGNNTLPTETDKMNSLSYKPTEDYERQNGKPYEPKVTKAKYTLPGLDLQFEIELPHLENLQKQDPCI